MAWCSLAALDLRGDEANFPNSGPVSSVSKGGFQLKTEVLDPLSS